MFKARMMRNFSTRLASGMAILAVSTILCSTGCRSGGGGGGISSWPGMGWTARDKGGINDESLAAVDTELGTPASASEPYGGRQSTPDYGNTGSPDYTADSRSLAGGANYPETSYPPVNQSAGGYNTGNYGGSPTYNQSSYEQGAMGTAGVQPGFYAEPQQPIGYQDDSALNYGQTPQEAGGYGSRDQSGFAQEPAYQNPLPQGNPAYGDGGYPAMQDPGQGSYQANPYGAGNGAADYGVPGEAPPIGSGYPQPYQQNGAANTPAATDPLQAPLGTAGYGGSPAVGQGNPWRPGSTAAAKSLPVGGAMPIGSLPNHAVGQSPAYQTPADPNPYLNATNPFPSGNNYPAAGASAGASGVGDPYVAPPAYRTGNAVEPSRSHSHH